MKILPRLFVVITYASVTQGGRAAVPSGCYVPENGMVYDRRTKLTWQLAVNGSYAWDQPGPYCQALSLGGGGWRLPSAMELVSIVDYSRNNPSIDPVAFPGTPADLFWSSTRDGALNWINVNFHDGSLVGVDQSGTSRVRCVR
jgi:hypothetical protein